VIRCVRTIGWLVLPALLLATACSGPPAEPSSTPSAASSPGAESTPSPVPLTGPEVNTIAGHVLGGGDYPGYTVEAPAGWFSISDGHFLVGQGSIVGVSVWDVGEVPRDPCHWQDSLRDPGPSVDDLVGALTTQRLRRATEPTRVTLDGYEGFFLEWSVPADAVVTGDAEFQGCDFEPPNGLRDFVSWFGNGFGERYHQVAGQVDKLWVLDVEGQRLVVDATYSPDTPEAHRSELAAIVESLRFTDQAA
jgi:hypothetical protein